MKRPALASRLFLAGTLLLAVSLPLSVFGMSLAQFILLGAWLLEGDIRSRLRRTMGAPLPMLLAGLYLLHLAGVFYSTDFDYAFKDLRIKLPLLMLPILFYTAPGNPGKHATLILRVLVAAVLASTLISIGVLHDWLPHEKPVTDIRDISVFISHIRLSLLVCFCVLLIVWQVSRAGNLVSRVTGMVLACWFLYFLYVLESMTGILILALAAISMAVRYVIINRRFVLPLAAALAAMTILLVWYVRYEASAVHSSDAVDFDSLPAYTANGHPYTHFRDRPEQENGHLVWTFICEEELEPAWNQRSDIDYRGSDLRGHELKYTLIRFLASKGLTRDSAGLAALDDDEIRAVEDGIANVDFREMGDLRLRVRKTVKEYYLFRAGANPTGSSLMQRLEYWKAGLRIFKQHPFTGVGTGDVQLAFDDEYRRSDTRLAPGKWHRAHNQFLTFGITFGVAGLLYFCWMLAYPVVKSRRPFPYLAFWLIAVLSMLTEDTLETQAGVTFFAFLNCFLLFQYPTGSPKQEAL